MRHLVFLTIVGAVFMLSGPVLAENSSERGLHHAAANVFSAAESMLIRDYYAHHRERERERFHHEWEEDDDHGKHKHKHKKKHKGGKGKDKGLPPGLAKRESLPPGLARQLEKNGTLPPGLAKRNLPYDLERRLSVLDRRYERVIVDRDVVLVQRATGVILDILRNVVR